MRIVLYFGSFNPIHIGHLGLAQYVLDHTDCEELWFVVSPHNPLKQKGDLWDDDLRFRYVNEAIRSIPNVKAIDTEFRLPQPNYTVNTLRHLSQQYLDHQFTLLIGEDNYNIFDKWRDWQDILANYRIFVYPRHCGEPSDRTKFPQMVWLDDAPLFDISSTEIRERLRNGESVDGMCGISGLKE